MKIKPLFIRRKKYEQLGGGVIQTLVMRNGPFFIKNTHFGAHFLIPQIPGAL